MIFYIVYFLNFRQFQVIYTTSQNIIIHEDHEKRMKFFFEKDKKMAICFIC